jgi:hypothetical protein
MLESGTHRDAAARMARSISRAGGVIRAVDIIEEKIR